MLNVLSPPVQRKSNHGDGLRLPRNATIILIMTANPFQSTASLDFGPPAAAASVQTVVVEIPTAQVPAAPYIIIGPAN